MDQDDREFESYLRKFQPRRPKPLPSRIRVIFLRWRAPAAAAILIVLLGTVLGLVLRHSRTKSDSSTLVTNQPQIHAIPVAQQVSLGRLNAAAREGPASLDAVLDKASPNLLPDVERGHGVLSALAANSPEQEIYDHR